MCRKKCLVLVLTLISLGLLLSIISFSVSAGDIRLENSIGRHLFDLSEVGEEDILVSEGYVAVTNIIDEDVELLFEVSNKLSPVDLGPGGKPRKHNVDYKVYYPLPDKSWVELEDIKFLIPAKSTYQFCYTLTMPIQDAYEGINKNTSNGFLCYINVRGLSSNIVGINYNYKLFVVFEGEVREEEVAGSFGFGLFPTILPIILLGAVGILFTYDKIKVMKIKKRNGGK